ncbi:hypothetical protein HHI36_023005 [Cryptolaemus montrouzieri]|uniref:Uncharacterized protein n=1 Tax=Cryptolaemus montrouzieri TaxID=559131 RepID=A0ABD2PFM2_9CUCU
MEFCACSCRRSPLEGSEHNLMFVVKNGVMLDKQITMGKQVEQAAKNMKNKTAVLTKLMPTTRGSTWLARQLLCSVAHSVGLYGDDRCSEEHSAQGVLRIQNGFSGSRIANLG